MAETDDLVERRHVAVLAAPIFAALIGAHTTRGRVVEAGELRELREVALREARVLWEGMKGEGSK